MKILTVTLCVSKFLRPSSFRPTTQMVRHKGGREHCKEESGPRCSPEELAKTECAQNKKEEKPESQFKSLWENPDCCIETCKEALPRFDELYYKISDKANRVYMRTWSECPELRIVRKPLCCFDKVEAPPIERRARSSFAAKKGQACKDGLPPCLAPSVRGPCPKITLPGCRAVRDTLKCFEIKKPSNCKKVCTPYPAFSECKRPPLKKKPPVECDCLAGSSMCTLWAMVRAGLIKMKQS